MMVSSQSYYFSCIVTFYFFFFVSIIVLSNLAQPIPHYCRDDQRDALLEFKQEFPVSSGNEKLFSSWNKNSDCCSWEAVECDAKSGEVISVYLYDSVLNSSLKTNSSLFKLQHLQMLTLANCSLYGDIPSSLGNLPHLTDLDLSGNELVGQVPSSLGKVPHLKYLRLSSNELVGQVPSSLGNLTQLELLELRYNNFSGNIPDSFANLAKLSELIISGNRFTSGNFFFLLPNLTSLSTLLLNSNNFQSKFPSDMSGLHNLEYFDARENLFSGPFPKSLFNNPSLYYVDLGRNQFKGPIEFGNTSSLILRYLGLAYNNFDGSIPESISNLDIFGLDLSNNKFEGQVPGCLRRIMRVTLSHNAFSSFGKSWEASDDSEIDTLMLDSNSFQGPFPNWICNLNSLMILELSNNLFNGSIPPCLRNSTSILLVLGLRNNSLSGVLPDIFIKATTIRVLDVSRNQLEGPLPKSLINCRSMIFLNVGRNKIKDEFPSWLGSLPMLNVLLLRSNQFYGPLYHRHVSLGFHKLRVIDVSHNDLSGTLPPFYFSNWLQMTTLGGPDDDESSIDARYIDGFYANFASYNSSMEMVNKGVDLEFERIHRDYKAIDFSGNRLWGNIPGSIGLLKGLHLLNLSSNAFTGNIPPSLENLTNLEALDLSRNRLSGQIPRGLGSLSALSYMDFSYNNLQGPVPRGTQFQRQNCSSFMNNSRLYGLEEICAETHVPNPTPQQSEESPEPEEPMINWLAAGIAYGPGVLCGLVIGNIFAPQRMKKFGRSKPRVVTTSAP